MVVLGVASSSTPPVNCTHMLSGGPWPGPGTARRTGLSSAAMQACAALEGCHSRDKWAELIGLGGGEWSRA